MEFAAESHPGNRYQHNEDALGWIEDAGVWLVADGMGGHACGDVASRVVKQSLLQASAAAREQATPPSLTELISRAHADVVAEGVRRSAENMGSTVVMVRVNGNRAEVGWCGDSRVYLWRNQELIRLTRDHSLLEQLLESGVVDPAEAFGHPQKHVLVQALGIANPEPTELVVDLANDDMLLLCSDGLHDELRDDEINDLIVASPEPTEAVGALVAKTLLGPARDNISVVCIRFTGIESRAPALSVEQLRQRFERLPGRRTAVAAAAPDDDLSGAAPAPRVLAATKIKLPTKKNGLKNSSTETASDKQKNTQSAQKLAPGSSKLNRNMLITLLAGLAVIVLLVLAS